MKEFLIENIYEISLIISGLLMIFFIVLIFKLKKIDKEQNELFYKLLYLYLTKK